ASLPIHHEESPVCGEYFHHGRYLGRDVVLQFSGWMMDEKLESILISVPEETSREELVAALKEKVPNVRYTPSRHQPFVNENENPTPLYLLPDREDLAVLIKPGTGVYLSVRDCLD
ncbi:MAG: hypothetical protein ACOC24_01405, partial [Desulfovibrionales bacterium]